MARRSIITVADEQVGIVTVCQMLGMDLPDEIAVGRSRKVPCPFGALYHSDGGVAASMRIYLDSNAAFCFNCSVSFTPVSLFAQATGMDRRSAAERLLDRIGYRPVDSAGQWQQAQRYEPLLDKAMLAEALKAYCRRITPDFARRQFDPPVAATLTRCLSVLDLVVSADDVQLWLSRCKQAMAHTLNSQEPIERKKETVCWEVEQSNEEEHTRWKG